MMDSTSTLDPFWIWFLEGWKKYVLRLIGSTHGLNPVPMGHRDASEDLGWQKPPVWDRPPTGKRRITPRTDILDPEEVKSRLMARK